MADLPETDWDLHDWDVELHDSPTDGERSADERPSLEAAVRSFLDLKAEWSAAADVQDGEAYAVLLLEHAEILTELGPDVADLALDAVTSAVEADPRSARARRERAEMLLELGRMPAALDDIGAALALAPDDAETLCAAAGLYAAAGREADALALEPRVRRALDLARLPSRAECDVDGFFASLRTGLESEAQPQGRGAAGEVGRSR